MNRKIEYEIQYGPIKAWPGKLRSNSERIKAPFKSGHASTLTMLERELRKISAEGAVVQLAMKHFNRDGRPYSEATPDHPGVIVSFHKPVRRADGSILKVPLQFAADRFKTWETNLRAVAIGLEDLRRIDRYGITTGSQQYLGFKALPPPGPEHEAIQTVEDAARFIASGKGIDQATAQAAARVVMLDAGVYRAAYRSASLAMHPDAGGKHEDWAKLQAAKTLLDGHHKL